MNTGLKRRLLLVRWHVARLDRAQFRRWIYKLSRPSSNPYISGDGFRKLANHIYDETSRHVNAKQVKDGDIIFISTYYVPRFFEGVGRRIESKYTVITHNADLAVNESMVSLCGGNVLCWFAQNNTFFHEKVVPIPIGLENLHYYEAGVPEHFTDPRRQAAPKKNRAYVSFSIGTNAAERQRAYDNAAQVAWADRSPQRLEHDEYFRTLATYKFVVSPPGNGLDTHRTWEAMYLGVVPIVKDSVATRSFERLGLPLWIVRDWDELPAITEHDLEKKYEELRDGFDSPALFMDYWRDRIRGWHASNTWSESQHVGHLPAKREHQRGPL